MMRRLYRVRSIGTIEWMDKRRMRNGPGWDEKGFVGGEQGG